MTDLAARYLSLLKSALLNDLYLEAEGQLAYLIDSQLADGPFDIREFFDLHRRQPELIEEIRSAHDSGRHLRGLLRYVTIGATMIGRARLENLHECLQAIHSDGVPGDLIECGAWRGGACIFMAGFLAAYDVSDRMVWVADSFEGVPAPRLAEDEGLDLSAGRYPMLAVDDDQVREMFRRFDLDLDCVRFAKGWFRDTLATLPIDRLALLRIDGDLYESTRDALTALYDKVAPGGFVIVDDYGLLEPCARATNEFRAARGIEEPLVDIDGMGIFWRKT
jgi:hypothetical protein